jgi:hypothetical protein
MKEYKLAAWPDLPAVYRRTAFRRVLNEMSQRFVTQQQLQQISGLSRHDLSDFLALLSASDALRQRGDDEPESWFGALQPMSWLRRPAPSAPRRSA